MPRTTLSDLFPGLPPEIEPCAVLIYRAVFDDLSQSAWSQEGTTITRHVNGKKLHVAPRRTYCTIGFRRRGVIEFYRFLGGECPAGEVTIKIPYDSEWDPIPVKRTIAWYLGRE